MADRQSSPNELEFLNSFSLCPNFQEINFVFTRQFSFSMITCALDGKLANFTDVDMTK